jgi:Maltokinase N-terminal cap domain
LRRRSGPQAAGPSRRPVGRQDPASPVQHYPRRRWLAGQMHHLGGLQPSTQILCLPSRGTAARGVSRAGGFRLDEPQGEIRIEFMVVAEGSGDTAIAYQVPLTYPARGRESGLTGMAEHECLDPPVRQRIDADGVAGQPCLSATPSACLTPPAPTASSPRPATRGSPLLGAERTGPSLASYWAGTCSIFTPGFACFPAHAAMLRAGRR